MTKAKKQPTSLKAIYERIIAFVRTGRPVLVVVMRPFCIQGLVVRRESGSIRAKRFADVEFGSTVRSPKIRMARIMEKFGTLKFKAVTIVTSDVSPFVVDLPLDSGKVRSGGKLDRLALWEASSFLEYPPDQALSRVVVLPREAEEDDFFPVFEEEERAEGRRSVLVTVFPSRVFAALSRLCRGYGKKLVAVAPEEVFAMTSRLLAGPNCQCVMVDCQMHELLCVVMDQGMPRTLVRGTVEAGESHAKALVRQLEILALPPEMPVYLLGELASECRLPLDDEMPEAHSWTVVDEICAPDASWGPLPGSYAAALGAALDQEVMSVNDRVSLGTMLRNNIFILPLVLFIFLMLGMGGSYGFLWMKTQSIKADVREYSQEMERLNEILANDERVKNEKQDLEDTLQSHRIMVRYLQEVLPRRNEELLIFLAEVTRCVPPDVSLNRLFQTSDLEWYIRGESVEIDPIIKMQDRLDGIAGIRSAKRETVKPVGDRKPATHTFEISIELEADDGR